MLENVEFEQHEQLSRPASSSNNVIKTDLADLVVAYLEQLGVEYIFGVPGGAVEPLYDAIARNLKRGGTVNQIVARHEAGAAFMADGYARETGKLAVCITTSGPGATNLLTAVATAYSNNVPMLVITAQPAISSFGRHSLQESSCTGIDLLAMFRPCTRYNSLVSHPQQLEWKLCAALQHAIHTTPGPVHLTIPSDILRNPHPQHALSFQLNALTRPPAVPVGRGLDSFCGMVKRARKMVLLIGADCGESIDLIMQFAHRTGATFITTQSGKGLVSTQHPLYRGVLGFAGHSTATSLLTDEELDVMVAIGTSLGEWSSGGWSTSVLNHRLVHIDASEEHLARSPMARLHLHGSIWSIFEHLLERLPAPHSDERRAAGASSSEPGTALPWLPSHALDAPDAFYSEAEPIKPQRLMKELGDIFPHGTRFLADAGNSIAWAIHYLQPHDRRMGQRRTGRGMRAHHPDRRRSPGGWLRVTEQFAPMGWAIGAAIGTAAANPNIPVVCITGDGSFLMSGQELSVAVAEQLTVIFVILNDCSLGMVKHGQRLGGGEQIAYALPPTDFAAMANAQGGIGHTIRSARELLQLDMEAICNHPGPTLLDIHIDPEEVPPMASRLRVLLEPGA